MLFRSGTAILSGLSMWGKNPNQNAKRWLVTAESVWMTANFTESIKMAARRNRPYTQAAGFKYNKRDDVFSFFSGHSSLASAFLTSAYLMRRQEPISSKGQKWLIGGAFLTTGITASMRIYAGKHYPSDVIVGLISGMGIAWLNYKIHEH